MIPELDDNVLPEGIHVCTIDEVAAMFGRFWVTDRRIMLTAKLRRFVEEARKSGFVQAIIIDGSYVTGKKGPSDIDVIVGLRPDTDLSVSGGLFAIQLTNRRVLRRDYGVDVRSVPDRSDKFNELVEYYTHIRPDDPEQASGKSRKGLLRIELC